MRVPLDNVYFVQGIHGHTKSVVLASRLGASLGLQVFRKVARDYKVHLDKSSQHLIVPDAQ